MTIPRDKLEDLLIAEKGLVKILEQIRSRIELLRAVDKERKKHDTEASIQIHARQKDGLQGIDALRANDYIPKRSFDSDVGQ